MERVPLLIKPCHKQAVCIAIIGITAFTSLGKPLPQSEIQALPPSQTIQRTMTGAETHRYKFELRANEFFQVRVEQKGVDVTLKLIDASGKVLATMDSPNGKEGPETLSFVATVAGRYLLAVSAFDLKAETGTYTIRRETPRTAMAKEGRRVEVEQLFVEGMTARDAAGQTETAIKKLEDAEAGWQELHDEYLAQLTAAQVKQIKEAQSQPELRPLPLGTVIERPLIGGENHFYVISLNQGQLFHLDLREKGIPCKIVLARIADQQIIAQADFGHGHERETLTLIAEQSGSHVVAVSSPQSGLSGNYEITAIVKDSATESDKKRIAAERLLAEGIASRNTKSEEGLRVAIMKWEAALPLWKDLGEKYWEGYTSAFLGRVLGELGDREKALTFFNLALSLSRAEGDRAGEAATLNNIGGLYADLGQSQKALEFYELALPLSRAVGDRRGEATILNGIGRVYSALGEQSKALESYDLALPLYRAAEDRKGEGVVYNNIGLAYSDLAEEQKALEFYNHALALFRAVGDHKSAAHTLDNIAGRYLALGQVQRALESYESALPLFRAAGDRDSEAIALNNIGKIYDDSGEIRKALGYYNLALPLFRTVGRRAGEAVTLNNIGHAHAALGELPKALQFYVLALFLHRLIGDHGEGATLVNLMSLWIDLGQRRLAIFYGKLAINNYQQLRQNIQTLENKTQRTYLRSVESSYRVLTELLILESRLGEAQQVLNRFKDQQYLDFNHETPKKMSTIAFSQREAEVASHYETASDNARKLQAQIDEINSAWASRAPNSEESTKLRELVETDSRAAANEFVSVTRDAVIDFSGAPDAVKDRVLDVADTREMQTGLRWLNASTKENNAAVYTLVGEEKFSALIITENDITAVSSSIKSSELNQKAEEFWALLQHPEYDPKILAQELYTNIFKPIEAKLPRDTKTIMWSLDGRLNYVPMAALHDGKQYLVTRYDQVVFTRADIERLTRNVNQNWTGLGLSSSKQHSTKVLNRIIAFGSLPGAAAEMQAIFKQTDNENGIFDGQVLQDDRFTRDSMLAALKQKRPLVHISSHFSFTPGDESLSFLLLGDGTTMSLSEMKEYPYMFAGVELLTLSACNTAAQREGANGEEIDGFAELAQRLGAGAVMASLWPVADDSTPRLMRGFYEARQRRSMNKAEALRQSQMALLSAAMKTISMSVEKKGTEEQSVKIVVLAKGVKRSDGSKDNTEGIVEVEEKYVQPFKPNRQARFAHPYYWSPFILFGNWK